VAAAALACRIGRIEASHRGHALLQIHTANPKPGYSSIRENLPQTLPDRPPFTAHLGNLSYEATSEGVTEFFEGCQVVSVRLIEDREMQRPKGFGYVEFGDVEGLKKALTLDGESFNGRMIKIKIADPRKFSLLPKVTMMNRK
jgi:translation initiation factor 4B